MTMSSPWSNGFSVVLFFYVPNQVTVLLQINQISFEMSNSFSRLLFTLFPLFYEQAVGLQI